MSCAFFDPDWNLLLFLLSAGKKISFNGIKKFNSIIYARTKTEL
jgi:hypothetical protein